MNFLGLNFNGLNLQDSAEELINGINSGSKYHVLTVNALIAHELIKNPRYRIMTSKVNYAVPDGSGIIKALKLLFGRVHPRVAGIDLMLKLCDLSRKHKLPIFLLGSNDSTIDNACEKLKSIYPGLLISGSHSGYFNEIESDKIVDEINRSGAKLVFVGMGVPKQEDWIYSNYERLGVSLAMGVGGSFDVVAGNIRRAPLWIQKIGFEWLYRTLQQPRRRLKVLPKLVGFGFHVLKLRFRRKRGGNLDY